MNTRSRFSSGFSVRVILWIGAVVSAAALSGSLFGARAQTARPPADYEIAADVGFVRVHSIRFATHPEHTRVVVDLDARVRYTIGQLADPVRLYLDLLDTHISREVKNRQIPVGDTFLRQIRVGQAQVGVTRVVLDLNSAAEHSVFVLPDPPRLVVDLRKPSPAGAVGSPETKKSVAVPASPAVSGDVPPQIESAPGYRSAPLVSSSELPLPAPGMKAERAPLPESAGAPETPPPSSTAIAGIRKAAPVLEPSAPLKLVRPTEQVRTLRIPRVTRPPKLADFLNGTSRESEVRVTDFRQREPGDGVPASRETTVYLSYDHKNLYIVFVCKDEPSKIRAHMDNREKTSGDDQVAVYLDTFRDHQRAYFFATNPLGIQTDGIFSEGQNETDLTFDTLWYSEGRLIEDGYIVWIALPFRSLRFSNNDPQTWGIALNRTIARNDEDTYWPYITDRVEGFTQQMADLKGLERISPGRNIQLIPYGMFTAAHALDIVDPDHFGRFSNTREFKAGLDAKYVLRDAVTFDFTVNPDFSNVESDDPQVTLNERFEVLFPEKRPLFIENQDFFQTPVNLFYSRRIVDPQFGFRTTGKVGPWAVGVLAIDDRTEGMSFSTADPLRGRRSGIGVARMRRDFGKQSNIGVFVSSLDFANRYNRVFSVDTRLKLSPNWVFTGQAITSMSKDLDGRHKAGPGYLAGIERAGRHLIYSGSYEDLSPGFDGDQVGFIPRVDIRQMTHTVDYYFRPEGRRLLSFGPSATFLRNWDHAGRLQDWLVDAGFVLNFANSTQLKFGRLDHYEVFQNIGLRHHGTDVSFSTAPRRWLILSSSFNQGTGINFIAPAPLPPFLGNATRANFAFTLRPTSQLRLDGSYFYTRLGARQGSLPPGIHASGSIFNNHLTRLKVNYQFTNRLSLRGILDYDATLLNNSLANAEKQKTLTGDILFTYLVHPGTALYIGYTNRLENLAIDPTIPPTLRATNSLSTTTGRQFFIKFSYLLLFRGRPPGWKTDSASRKQAETAGTNDE